MYRHSSRHQGNGILKSTLFMNPYSSLERGTMYKVSKAMIYWDMIKSGDRSKGIEKPKGNLCEKRQWSKTVGSEGMI